jgi:(E)-4-hydroxy-3-methylbut-2-enyl-diphosphate synthase
MVHSALEYLRICREAGFEEIVVALKASNPAVMIAANRLLAERMRDESFNQPIHLGVTEAGAGAQGALRSAVGICTLLTEGIGDTIRVSLTGDPAQEIAVCRRIVHASADAARDDDAVGAPLLAPGPVPPPIDATWSGLAVGGAAPPRVELALSLGAEHPDPPDPLPGIAYAPGEVPESLLLRWTGNLDAAAAARLDRSLGSLRRMAQRVPGTGDPPAVWLEPEWTQLTRALSGEAGETRASAPRIPEWLGPILSTIDGLSIPVPHSAAEPASDLAPLAALTEHRPGLLLRYHLAAPPAPSQTAALLDATARGRLSPPCFSSGGTALAATLRALAAQLGAMANAAGGGRPLLAACLPDDPWAAAARVGPLLLGGIVDVVIAEQASRPPKAEEDTRQAAGGAAAAAEGLSPLARAYGLLQATRRRLTRAEFISCPGCGRLSYDLETTVRRVKARFGHLPGLKIAIMGCVVNGPGEMADADFGYVGASRGLVDLYAGRRCVRHGLTPEAADDLLIQLLREGGRWSEPA